MSGHRRPHRTLTPLPLTLLLAVSTLSPFAAAQSLTPAAFSSGEKSLAELIEFPELRGDVSIAINCFGVLQDNGKLDPHGCYQREPGEEAFIASIYKATKKARLQPATYDGKRVDVVFQYRVQFTQKGEDKTLDFAANPGYEENIEAYGSEHIAAQRVFGRDNWEKDCPKQARFVVLGKANVDSDGTPSAASVTHGSGIQVTDKCQKAIVDAMLSSRYIPAQADGEAVPSTFVEPFGN